MGHKTSRNVSISRHSLDYGIEDKKILKLDRVFYTCEMALIWNHGRRQTITPRLKYFKLLVWTEDHNKTYVLVHSKL